MSDLQKDDRLHWPEDREFTFANEPGEHDPCYVVLPDGAMLPLNHWNNTGTDIARAKWIVDACNEKLRRQRGARDVSGCQIYHVD